MDHCVSGGLRIVAGRPMLVAPDGSPLVAMYSETFPRDMHRRNVQMAAAGVEVFVLIVRVGFNGGWQTTWFWRDDNVYGDESDRSDDLAIERQAAAILEVCPTAYFMIRWGSEVPEDWALRHPDELQADETSRLDRASYASMLANKGREELAGRIVSYCEARAWGHRIIGYLPFGQDEGTHELSIKKAMFDQSPVMRRAYRAFLDRRYGSDAALRDAWKGSHVTCDSALPPTDSEWQHCLERWMHWPEPCELRRFQDYFLLLRNLQAMQRRTELAIVRRVAARPVVTATDAYKQPMHGWLLNDAFDGANDGMCWRNILLASGCIDAGEALDMPELDALITPADYTARATGFGWDAEGIADSLVLRGKTILIEDDARSWVTANERGTQGAWRTSAECRAGLLRNLAIAASRGHIPYWMNVGQGYFDDPIILDIIREQIPLRRTLLTRALEPTEHAIAVILDDTSPLDENFTAAFQNLAVLRQRNDHLHLTGLPWRVYLLSDLERQDFPVFRAYLLPNLFRLDAKRIALIQTKLIANGSVVIFGPGTGISDGIYRDASLASELMGFPVEITLRETARRVLAYGGAHPALADMRGPLVYGDSHAYGPLLEPAADLAASGAVELGRGSTWWQSNKAGLVLREFGRGARGSGRSGPYGAGDGAVIFSVAAPFPAELLRALALYGGCTPWSDIGDVVAANGNMLALHTMRPGRRTLHLPKRATLVAADTGCVEARDTVCFDVELKAPETRIWLMN